MRDQIVGILKSKIRTAQIADDIEPHVINAEAVADEICAIITSTTRAAEPDAWMCRSKGKNQPWGKWLPISNEEKNKKPDNFYIYEYRPLHYATPPVRVDREAIARIRYEYGHYSLRDVLLEGFQAMKFVQPEKAVDNMLDAILSLPVQPGAGERDDAISVFAALTNIADQYDDREDDAHQIFVDCDQEPIRVLTLGICRKARSLRALSRQPPQSSRDGEGR